MPRRQLWFAASLLWGFGIAANLAYSLAAVHGAGRVAEVARAAWRAKDAVSGGRLVAALRDGGAFVIQTDRGATAFVTPVRNTEAEPNAAKNTAKIAPEAATILPAAPNEIGSAPAPASDELDALTPTGCHVLSERAEQGIRAATPL